MKILLLSNSGEGIYRFRKELLQTLVLNNEVFVSVPENQYNPKIEDIGCKIIVTEVDRRGTNIVKDLSLISHYKKIIKTVQPDVVLTYTIKPNIYGGYVCRKYKIPYLCNITGLGSALENEGILQVITSNMYKFALKKAYKVFFQNEASKDFMRKLGIVKDNYVMIPGSGVNLEQYTVKKYPEDKTIEFVFVGRIMKEKGFDQYVEAARYIRSKYPETRFNICGFYEDDYAQIMNELIEDDIVVYHGAIENMVDMYNKIHCTIHPTYYPEGMSNVLLESLACGRPIITTDRPGCKEIIEDGINGFIVRQKDSQDLIEKIEKFLSLSNKQRAQLGLNGRKKVEQQFDRNIVVNKYIEAINEATDNV